MTKLMEQVKEIQRKAHVCPECEGKKEIEFDCEDAPGGIGVVDCWICKDGTVEAPDIDALVGAIEVLAKTVATDNRPMCGTCLHAVNCIGDDYPCEMRKTRIAALSLIANGLPGEGGT